MTFTHTFNVYFILFNETERKIYLHVSNNINLPSLDMYSIIHPLFV